MKNLLYPHITEFITHKFIMGKLDQWNRVIFCDFFNDKPLNSIILLIMDVDGRRLVCSVCHWIVWSIGLKWWGGYSQRDRKSLFLCKIMFFDNFECFIKIVLVKKKFIRNKSHEKDTLHRSSFDHRLSRKRFCQCPLSRRVLEGD